MSYMFHTDMQKERHIHWHKQTVQDFRDTSQKESLIHSLQPKMATIFEPP